MDEAAAEPEEPEVEPPDAPQAGSSAPPGDWLHRYTAALQRGTHVILLAWVAIVVVGLYAITEVFANLQLQVRATRAARLRACGLRSRSASVRRYLAGRGCNPS